VSAPAEGGGLASAQGEAQDRSAYWAGSIAAPLVFLAYLALEYALVPWACQTGRHGVLHTVSALALALTLVALAVGWRDLKRAPAQSREDSIAAQPRFFAQIALAIGVLSAVAVAAVWFTQWVLGPCLG
jgi:hypothetical protein